jgi:hypothetical protein
LLLTTTACAEQKTAPPDVPVPPSLVPKPLKPKPPPLPPRKTKVLPLDWKTCSDADRTLIEFTGGDVVARCETAGTITRLQITIAPTSTLLAGGLRHVTLRFCGDVQSSEAPAGWHTRIGYWATAADVTWGRFAEAETDVTSSRVTGFAVTLRGKWRRGINYQVADSAMDVAAASPHDCPWPLK